MKALHIILFAFELKSCYSLLSEARSNKTILLKLDSWLISISYNFQMILSILKTSEWKLSGSFFRAFNFHSINICINILLKCIVVKAKYHMHICTTTSQTICLHKSTKRSLIRRLLIAHSSDIAICLIAYTYLLFKCIFALPQRVN